jgi:hypothetical protein
MPHAARSKIVNPGIRIPMGKFFLAIIVISIALVLGTAILITHF